MKEKLYLSSTCTVYTYMYIIIIIHLLNFGPKLLEQFIHVDN